MMTNRRPLTPTLALAVLLAASSPAWSQTDVLTIENDMVGIGTETPTRELHTRGDMLLDGFSTNAALFTNSTGGAVTFEFTTTHVSPDSWQFGVRANDTFIVTPTGTIGSPVFILDASGNVTIPAGSTYNGSDQATKTDLSPVDPREVLMAVAQLPLSTWKRAGSGDNALHLGPMAQDFAAAFGLGKDDKTIATMDMAGVALAAIQGLHAKVAELDELRATLAARDAEVGELSRRLERLEEMLPISPSTNARQ